MEELVKAALVRYEEYLRALVDNEDTDATMARNAIVLLEAQIILKAYGTDRGWK